MEVIITEWALQSYISLKAKAVFSDNDYQNILRPDAELLKTDDPFDPSHPKFSNDKFWGPATFKKQTIKYGYKMKWRNFGPGRNQLRLGVVIAETEIDGVKEQRSFLCSSYVKDDKREKAEMAKMKTKIKKILDGTYYYRGKL
jgi:hypothetical protein